MRRLRPRSGGSHERIARFVIGLALVASASTATAGTQDQARVALHVKAHTVKATTICTSWSPNAQNLPCSEYVTSGLTGRNYDVYLVVGHGDPTAGIAGVSCRIQYDNVEGRGIDMFGWALCADYEAVGDGGFGNWPASGGSNSITWNATTNCQRTEIAGEGVHAVAGAFYVYAYSADHLWIGSDLGAIEVKDCQGSATYRSYASPLAVFSASGYVYGENPCEHSYYPTCPISPEEVNFGSIWANDYRDSTILVRNEQSTTIQGTWSASGGTFSLLSSGGPFELAPGATMPVTVRFDPAVYGTAEEGWLVSGPCLRIGLRGYAIPTCGFTPNRLAFEPTAVGEKRILPVVLRNVSPTPVSGTLTVSGSGFHLAAGSSAYSLAAGESRIFEIGFQPVVPGSWIGALSAGYLCPMGTLAGTSVPACTVVPATGSFGTVAVGESRDIEFTVTNNLQQQVDGRVTASASPFRILAGGEPYSLASGRTHTFTVRFEPQATITYTGTISFGSPLGTMSVSGTGKLPLFSCLTLPGSDLNFGLAQLGVGRTEVIRFVNTGEGSFALTLSEENLSPNFSLPNGEGPFAVATGDTLDVPVRYDPVTTGVHVATLVANSPCANVRLSGFAQRNPLACIADASDLDFGDVPVGGSREMEFHLFNYSPDPATGDVSTPSGDFSVERGTHYQLAWADSQIVRVRFTPRTLGTQTCVVAAVGGCADTIEATGYGIAPPDTARARPWIFAASRPNEPVQRLVYEILSAAHVEIVLFDVVGHELVRFDEGVRAPGRFEVSWDARQHPSGIYFARIEAARASLTRRVLLLR